MESHNVARTREGHAALAGTADRWIIIQENTFKNWVNEQLRTTGQEVDNLVADFENGIKLCALIQALQGKRLRVISNTQNHHQKLANVSNALTAIANDNIRLVNIGPEDIVNGNLKLILGLIWHLILRYQIGKSKFPTKKLMIAWLRAVIPECEIQNFTSDWNDGVALHALIDFCKPGLCPNWKHLSRSEGLNNCRDAMMLAKQHFDIPLVVRPEDLSSSDLDELSGMTYLSYFMKLDSPGYNMTLNLVRNLLKPGIVNNFTSDWSDGQLLCKLVHSVGGHIPGWPALSGDPVHKIQLGLDGAHGLGIEPLLPARDMVDPEVDHIAIMAYAAYFLKFKPVKTAAEKVTFTSLPQNVSVKQKASFEIHFEDDDIAEENIKAEVIGPDLEKHVVHFKWVSKTGQGSFTPTETGIHKLNVYCDGKLIKGCPTSFKVLADRSKVTFSPVESCSLGTFTELQVNGSSAGEGHVQFQVRSPSGHTSNLNVIPKPGGYYVTNFNPTEIGDWEVSVKFDNENIPGSPYTINVFDPTLVKVFGLESGNLGSGISFNADATHAGKGKTRFEIKHNGTDVTKHCTLHEEKPGFYKIDFNAPASGTYQVHAFFNNVELQGSPYDLEIVDSSNISVSGEGLGLIPADRTATFEIHSLNSSTAKLDVSITGPTGSKVPAKVDRQATGSYTVNFLPVVAGEHKVTVLYGGQKIKGSPYTVRVYDASKVAVSNMPHTSVMGQPVVFNIDASKAGSGNIEIMVNDGEIACSVQNHGNFKFTASFMPNSTDEHVIQMKFNGQQVPGSPWQVAILDPGKVLVTGNGLEFVHVDRTASFSVNMPHMDSKKISVKIIAPNGSTVPHTIQKGNGDLRVEYVPKDVGDHKIEIKYADTIVNGSPFIAKAYNTAAIKVTPLPNGVVGQKIEFGIDLTKAGEGQLEIMVNNGDLPNTVESDELCVYHISFVPVVAGTHTVDIVFNKINLPDSPLTCNVINLKSAASVRNLEHHHAVGKTASFYVHSENLGEDLNVSVDVLSPKGQDVAVTYKKENNSMQKIEFVPQEVGMHTINVTYSGAHIGDSPYQVTTYDPKLVHFSKMPLGILNIPFKFRVLAEEAGDGKMEVTVESDEEKIPIELVALSEGTFEVTFMGNGEKVHTLSILFNGEHIPKSPIFINFADIDKIKIQKPNSLLVACDRLVSLQMTSAPTAIDDIVCNIEGPVYNSVPFKIRNVADRLYSIDWMPVKPGNYDVDVKFGNVIPVWGSPLKIKAYDSTKVKVIQSGCEPIVGERHLMKFDVSEAGEGKLVVIIMCAGETVQSAVNKGQDDLVWVTFEPQTANLYDVYATFNKEPIPGSPFKIDLSVDEPDCQDLALMNMKYFIVQDLQWCFLQTIEHMLPYEQIVMSITAPSGDRMNADVYRQSNGEYKVEWMPRMAGRHTIDLQLGGRQIDGSPFYVDVFDLSSIRVDNLNHAKVGDKAVFNVDFSKAGALSQEVQIISPSGVAVAYDIHDLRHMCKEYIYEPDEPGKYQIFVKYGGFQLPACPYIQSISDGGMPSASGSGLFFAEEDKPAHFNVMVGQRKGDLRVAISGPHSIAKCSVDPQSDGSYDVTYIPVETGIFDISVTWNGQDIPGSPYHPKVIDARKVRIIGGWHHFMDNHEKVNLVVGEHKQLPFDTSEAGPGTLKAEVKGPSRSLDVDIDTHTIGKSVVDFVPEEEGTHYIHISWCDVPLTNSPFIGFAIHQKPDATKLILTGRGLKEAIVREEAEFIIDGSQAGKGRPEVVLSGVRAEINVQVSALGNSKFRCSYIPTIPGAYLLHITWNGLQLRGSPYKVNVLATSYPNRVIVLGEGLKGGILGRTMDVTIDARRAGPGELSAHCMGPHQVAYCELEDNRDGTFGLSIKPQEQGRHLLQVKYSGEHVQGSPFVMKVTSQPDASKVRVHGPGVEHGILATYVSQFHVETKGAGGGQLTVRIRGPKGAFQVEMFRDSQRDRTILCKYNPVECGQYFISVRWSDVDVPGSPFQVYILDTQDELEQVLKESSYPNGTNHSRVNSQKLSQPSQRMSYGQWQQQIQ